MEGGTSLLTTEITTMISNFASALVPTTMAILTVVVPVGLTLWAVGFGIKKGINYLQQKANKAIG